MIVKLLQLGAAGGCLFLLGCDKPAPSANPPVKDRITPAASPEAGVKPLTNMVKIAPGKYQKGRTEVTISKPFWLGKFEVTQVEYAALMGINPSQFTSVTNGPVEKVKFTDAVAYCNRLTERERRAGNIPQNYAYRLPSEAEWEYACRAGTTNLYYFGPAEQADAHAWLLENSEGKTQQIGLKLPNPWGLYDMHGNVWEWTADWFGTNALPAALLDPTGPSTGKFKIFKGGGWNQAVEFARPLNKFMMAPDTGIHFVGFRIALSPVSP